VLDTVADSNLGGGLYAAPADVSARTSGEAGAYASFIFTASRWISVVSTLSSE